MNPTTRSAATIAVALLLTACEKPAPVEPAAPAPATEAPAAGPVAASPQPPATEDAAPAFVGKVWEVKTSSAVEPGTQYSFLADGILVIASENGPPGYGQWTYENGALTMIEEGVSYPTDILKLDDSTFELRSHNPGEPVTITLVPAKDVPLPTVPAQ